MNFTFAQSQGSRDYQQDDACTFTTDNKTYFVICDGLGWHPESAAASALAVDTMRTQIIEHGDVDKAIDYTAKLIDENWPAEFELVWQKPTPATTITVAEVFAEGQANFYWIGDSPAYAVYCNQRIEAAGFGHNRGNTVLRCAGASGYQGIDSISRTKNILFDTLVIGSDGTDPFFTDSDEFPVMDTRKFVAQDIVDFCAPLEGSDNVTVFVVEKESYL